MLSYSLALNSLSLITFLNEGDKMGVEIYLANEFDGSATLSQTNFLTLLAILGLSQDEFRQYGVGQIKREELITAQREAIRLLNINGAILPHVRPPQTTGGNGKAKFYYMGLSEERIRAILEYFLQLCQTAISRKEVIHYS